MGWGVESLGREEGNGSCVSRLPKNGIPSELHRCITLFTWVKIDSTTK